MTERWFRSATVGTQASFANAIARNVLEASGYRALSMRNSLAKGCDPGIVLFDPHFKSGPVFYRTKKQDRHGVNADTWKECKAIAGAHEGQSCIVIFEAFTNEFGANWSGTLLIQTVRAVGEPEHGRNERTMKVYWPRSAFVALRSFSPREAIEVAESVGAPDLSAKLESVLTPQKQVALF